MDWLCCVKTFIRIVDQGSFVSAARERYSSPSAVSKQLSWLEDNLNVQLLQRSTRHLQLTSAGTQFYQQAKVWVEQFDAMKQDISGLSEEVAGTLNIAAPGPSLFTQCFVTPVVIKFMQKYPNIKANIALSNRYVNLADEGFDVAYRAAYDPDPNYICEHLMTSKRVIVATPKYLKQHGTPKKPQDIKQHACLVHTEINYWQFKDTKIKVSGVFTANDTVSLKKAALAHLGLLCMSEYHFLDELKQKKLITVLDDYQPKPIQIYLQYPKFNIMPIKLRKFIQFVLSASN